jgi:hypothetical protein
MWTERVLWLFRHSSQYKEVNHFTCSSNRVSRNKWNDSIIRIIESVQRSESIHWLESSNLYKEINRFTDSSHRICTKMNRFSDSGHRICTEKWLDSLTRVIESVQISESIQWLGSSNLNREVTRFTDSSRVTSLSESIQWLEYSNVYNESVREVNGFIVLSHFEGLTAPERRRRPQLEVASERPTRFRWSCHLTNKLSPRNVAG